MYDLADQIAEEHLRLVRIKQDFIAAGCPFHGDGEERNPSFWINRASGEWGCFSCHERGQDLGELLKKIGVRAPQVEALIQEARANRKKTEHRERIKRQIKDRSKFHGVHTLPEALLGVFDYCPTQLLDEGFTEEVLDQHNIGYDRERSRITFPIRDIRGRLIGISGRTTINQNPKYKVYEGWHINWENKRVPGELGEWFPGYASAGIRDHLWRGHFVYDRLYKGEDSQLIVVEGYKAAMWLVQHGWWNTVALMGSMMSKQQERMIRNMGTETWIFLDNNDAGRRGTDFICNRLGNGTTPVYRCVYPGDCEEGTQPSDLGDRSLELILSSAVRAFGRRRRWEQRQ